MAPREAANGLLSTTDVVGLLYQRGVPVSRDRLYEMSDALFPEDTRRGPRRWRRFAPYQVDLLASAFRLYWDLGVEREKLAAVLRDPVAGEAISAQLQACQRELEVLQAHACQACAKEVSA